MKPHYLFYCLLFLCGSCKKDPPFVLLENLNNNDITVLGHRGMGEGYKFPGNTYEGIIPVLGIGADGAEIDIQMTKDSVLILFHDETMQLLTTCENRASNYNFAEIGGCKYHTADRNIYVISLENLLSRIENINNYQFSFDCKLYDKSSDSNFVKAYFSAIQFICKKYKIVDNVYLELNDALAKQAIAFGLTNKIFIVGSDGIETRIEQAKELGVFGVGTDWATSTAEQVKIAHNGGLWVMMWSPATHDQNIEALRLNPDILQTDKPINIIKMLERYNYDYRIP